MLILLKDAARRPEAFQWFGGIPRHELDGWLRREGIGLPSDILELWEATGGGDIFEETIYRPTVQSPPCAGFVADDIESTNTRHAAAGKPRAFYIFMDGSFFSAVHLRDQNFVNLTRSYAITNSFPSLDEWYLRSLKAEFGKRYGLD